MTEIISPPKKNLIFDASVFTTVEACARLADLRYNRSFISVKGKSTSLECGNIVHKVLEVYYKGVVNGKKRQDAINDGMAAGQLYISGCPYCKDFKIEGQQPPCKHQPNEYPGVYSTPEETVGHRIGWRWVLKTCEQYFDFYKSDSWIPLEIEVVKGEILYEDDEIRILWKAKIDLTMDTNQGIFPVDHKTMKQRREQTTLNNQFMGQCLLMKTKRMIKNSIGFQTSLKPEERFTREPIIFSFDRLHEWQSEILPYYAYKYLQYTDSGYWPPNFTHCDNIYGPCAFKFVCEADRNKREEVLNELFKIGEKWDPHNVEDE